jgi:hypothetical protein
MLLLCAVFSEAVTSAIYTTSLPHHTASSSFLLDIPGDQIASEDQICSHSYLHIIYVLFTYFYCIGEPSCEESCDLKAVSIDCDLLKEKFADFCFALHTIYVGFSNKSPSEFYRNTNQKISHFLSLFPYSKSILLKMLLIIALIF